MPQQHVRPSHTCKENTHNAYSLRPGPDSRSAKRFCRAHGQHSRRAPFKFPALTNVGRIAATYNFRNSFMGMYVVVNTWNMGDRDKMSTGIIRWRARMFYGIRF